MTIKTKRKPLRKAQARFTETIVNFILDKSGSMESVRSATISGFNEYIQTLKKDGTKYKFSLTLFDTGITQMYTNEPLEAVKDLDMERYSPGGGTALYDAACSTIKAMRDKVGKTQKVITVIMTDGEENSSKEYTEAQLKAMITELEKTGKWTFVFLGANQDSYASAQKFGIAHGNTANFMATGAGTARAFKVMAMATSNLSASGGGGTSAFFSASDKTSLMNEVDPVKAHMSDLGKKSWEARQKKLRGL
jgi:uncharacterized protein YegL